MLFIQNGGLAELDIVALRIRAVTNQGALCDLREEPHREKPPSGLKGPFAMLRIFPSLICFL
jgi:hypothetical protein